MCLGLGLQASFAADEEYKECYMILAGKDATADGSILLAHDNDLHGNEASFIQKIPRAKYNPGEVVAFSSGLEIPQVEETCEWMVLQIYKGFAEGDAIAVNEYQVAIAGGVALGGDRNEKAKEADPLIKTGLTGGVRYVALERSKTARECVKLIGELYSKYGVTYPSGVGVADPNEVWYIEPGGGHTWAAVRIPDDKYWIGANGYRIGEIDPRDKENVIVSPNLLEFAKEKGLWDSKKGPFSFREAFGEGRKPTTTYDSRRVWSGLKRLSPSANFDPEEKRYPLFATPDEKITIKKLISVLRDQYDNTDYAIHPSEGIGSNERAIAEPQCVHTDVLQLRRWMPADVGAVLWAGLGAANTTVYVPYYFGITDIPKAYQTAGPNYDSNSAFWVFRTLSTLVEPYYTKLIGDVLPVWQEMEDDEIALQPIVEKVALELYKNKFNKDLAKAYLTAYSNGLSLKALDMAREIASSLNTKIASHSSKIARKSW